MSPSYERADARRDRGLTLVEIVVSVVLIGILIVPIATAISVVLRTSVVSTDIVTESHDLQQAVNYLPADARAGSSDPTRYKTSADTDSGSGCSPTGSDNVLRIADADSSSSRNVAYELVSNGDGTASLDRWACLDDGTVLSSINIADELVDDGVTPAASSQLVITEEADGDVTVERVELILEQAHGAETVSAAPLAEPEVDASTSSSGDCTDNLLQATKNFTTFTESDLHINDVADIKRTTAIGGLLSWEDGAKVGQNVSSASDPDILPALTTMYIQKIDWANSDGELRIPGNGTGVVVFDTTDVTFVPLPSGGTEIRQTGVSNGPYINVQNGPAAQATQEIVDFADSFSVLRSCSAALAELPNSCDACAAQVQLWNQNNTAPYPGVGQPGGTQKVNVRLYNGRANVLNLTAAQLNGLGGTFSFSWQDDTGGSGNAAPTAEYPLIINVSDIGDVELTTLRKNQNSAANIMFNFPNAESVTVSGDKVWGTIFAPNAHVEVNTDVIGGIVARSWNNNTNELETGRLFDGEINWDA